MSKTSVNITSSQGAFRNGMVLLLLCAIAGTSVLAGTANKANSKTDAGNEVQRAAPTGAFEQQQNLVSNIDFQISNYGIFGYNIRNQVGGTYWPRGSNNQYLFASGAWFAALKRPPGSSDLRKRVAITYNPNSGQSWMVPGSIEDGNELDQGGEAINKNRIYFSTDFNSADGADLENPSLPKWPIWDASATDTLRFGNYYGTYINNIEERNKQSHSKGPAFISQEDIFCLYKDTDLSRYEGGALRRQSEGFPLGLQIEQMVYSWGFGDYADFVFLKYLFIHPKSYPDTLFACWMAGVMDADIGTRTNSQNGAANDHVRYYSEEDSLNLGVQWTGNDRGEANQGFGYLGLNFLESPAVDADGYIRNDKKQFPVVEQLGLRTMRNWPIAVDPIENEDRYNFLSSQDRDGDQGPGDRRMLMATGPFNMRPGDSARIVIGIVLAATATGKDATGTTEDMAELIRKVRFAQIVYNNQFRAPKSPDIPRIMGYQTTGTLYTVPEPGWLPLNNAIAIQWDSTAELSIDTLEAGMDFLGYRIYRARRTDLDTFARDYQPTARKGPLAWKQIAQIGLTPPFIKTSTTVGNTAVPIDDFILADIIKPGQRKILVARSASNALPWAGYWNELLKNRKPASLNPDGSININSISKFDSVTFTYMTLTYDSLPVVNRVQSGGNQWGLDTAQAKAAEDSLVRLILAKKVKGEPLLFTDTDDDGKTIKRPWEETNEVRRGIVAPYIHQITSGRQFYDEGDDDKNGDILYDPNPEQSEKLINNVNYYYAIRSYDEGDYLQGTSSKLGLRALGLSNTVTTVPLASRPTGPATVDFRIDPADSLRIGGIYNLKLLVTDQQRFIQLFAGRTLQLEFFRNWFGIDNDRKPETSDIGLYGLTVYLRDSASQALIGGWSTSLPPQLCGSNSLAAYFTENTVTWVDTTGASWKVDKTTGLILDTVYSSSGEIIRVDTTDFQLPDNMDKILRSGSYTTAAPCFGNKYALGTVGLSFDYAVQQWGGVYRSLDTSDVLAGGDPNIYVGVGRNPALLYNDNRALNQPGKDFDPPYPGWQRNPGVNWPTSYNNGPGIFEITFEEGGIDTITTTFRTSESVGDADGNGKQATFEGVPYLTMKVRNVAQFDRPDVRPDGTVGSRPVSYPIDLTNTIFPLDSVDQKKEFPNPELVPYDGYAIAAYGWRNPNYGQFKTVNLPFFAADSNNASPIGDMGRYYISKNLSRDGKDTLYFTHVITIAGAQFCIDYSRFGGRSTIPTFRSIPGDVAFHGKVGTPDPAMPTQDFKAGDKVRFYTFGGALGFPLDHTKAFAKIGAAAPEVAKRPYTSEEMEQIQVVPNPYYVTHEGIASSFQGKLYFTRLPSHCTIRIYTTAGELVNTFEHNEQTSEDPSTYATHVWDLLSKNRQRITSQTLVAKIETPDGSTVVRKFTVVVGPARIVNEE